MDTANTTWLPYTESFHYKPGIIIASNDNRKR